MHKNNQTNNIQYTNYNDNDNNFRSAKYLFDKHTNRLCTLNLMRRNCLHTHAHTFIQIVSQFLIREKDETI